MRVDEAPDSVPKQATSYFKLGRYGSKQASTLKKANPKDETTGRRKHKNFQWLTNNIGYPKLREHLGAVIATMKLSADWHDFKAKLDKNYPRVGKPTQLSLEFADEDVDTGKGL